MSVHDPIESHRIISERIEIILWGNLNNLNFHTLLINKLTTAVTGFTEWLLYPQNGFNYI